MQVVSLVTSQDPDGKVQIVVGFSQKLREVQRDIKFEVLGDKGESLYQDLEVKQYATKKSISSAWVITLPDMPSVPIVSLSIRKRKPIVLFRDFFVHLDIQNGKFELPAAEVWVAKHT